MVDFLKSGSFLVITEEAFARFKACAAKSYEESVEFGGFILAGKSFTAFNEYKVVYFSCERGTVNNFIRSPGCSVENSALEAALRLEACQIEHQLEKSIFYVGDWHTHFQSMLPSKEDASYLSINKRALLFIMYRGILYIEQASGAAETILEVVGCKKIQIR